MNVLFADYGSCRKVRRSLAASLFRFCEIDTALGMTIYGARYLEVAALLPDAFVTAGEFLSNRRGRGEVGKQA
jgi:hypothetical protein